MKNILVWDLPIRIFHWTFAGSLSASLAIGLLVDGDSPVFQLHMLLGLVAGFALVVRIVLGIVGSRYNRFSALPVNPVEVVKYLIGTFTGKARRYIGHNPGCAVAALSMFSLVPLLIASGTGWLGESGMDLHGTFAYVLLAAIVSHVTGIIWHSVRHKEALALSMVTGRKEGPPEEGLASANTGWAVAILAGGVAWVGALFASRDIQAETVRLPVLGTLIQLGEYEGNEGGEYGDGGAAKRENDDDD